MASRIMDINITKTINIHKAQQSNKFTIIITSLIGRLEVNYCNRKEKGATAHMNDRVKCTCREKQRKKTVRLWKLVKRYYLIFDLQVE